jgi:cytochrome P450
MRTLVQEIREHRTPSSAFTVEKFQSEMPYLNACINEGLRMYPPVPTGLPRTVPEGGAAICGSWVPQGVRVIPDSLCSILETPLRFCKYLTYS